MLQREQREVGFEALVRPRGQPDAVEHEQPRRGVHDERDPPEPEQEERPERHRRPGVLLDQILVQRPGAVLEPLLHYTLH